MAHSGDGKDNENKSGFAAYAAKRIILIVAISAIGLWGLVKVLDYTGMSGVPLSKSQTQDQSGETGTSPASVPKDHGGATTATPPPSPEKPSNDTPGTPSSGPSDGASLPKPAEHTPITAQAPDHQALEEPKQAVIPEPVKKEELSPAPIVNKQPPEGHRPFMMTDEEKKPKGVAFIEALVEPLNYELNERFWGWRPNDIIDVTDNVNNMQLGILEFTRRTSIVLAERLSRTGATASFDPNLQQAMNWFMIKAEQYWLPSPEDKYNEGLKNLRTYKTRLENGTAYFYTRNDNLIPLLSVYEDLLGGCEENLVKVTEDDGTPVSFFRADDYFYYGKGVAMAMLPVLEAISVDFASTL